jgi:hypothetical protein
MSIPFPFGLEEGCFAHEKFRLGCVSDNKFTVLDRGIGERYQVTALSVGGGYLGVTRMLNDSSSSEDYVQLIVAHLFDGNIVETVQDVMERDVTEFYQEFDIRMRWAVTNLTCESALQRSQTYACTSHHSECVNVTYGTLYVGYRCKCSSGFDGNPYIKGFDGCKGLSLSLLSFF